VQGTHQGVNITRTFREVRCCCLATKISQSASRLKHLVEAKLIGWRVLLKSWWFSGNCLFFSSSYFISQLLEIHARSAKNQDRPLIYYVLQLLSFFFWLVFLCFGFFFKLFFVQFHPFAINFVLFYIKYSTHFINYCFFILFLGFFCPSTFYFIFFF
jgi:hypothetical protein